MSPQSYGLQEEAFGQMQTGKMKECEAVWISLPLVALSHSCSHLPDALLLAPIPHGVFDRVGELPARRSDLPKVTHFMSAGRAKVGAMDLPLFPHCFCYPVPLIPWRLELWCLTHPFYFI